MIVNAEIYQNVIPSAYLVKQKFSTTSWFNTPRCPQRADADGLRDRARSTFWH